MTKYKADKKRSIDFKQIIGSIFVISGLVTMGINGYGVIRNLKRNNDALTQSSTIERTINNEYEELTEISEVKPEQIDEQEYISKYNFEELRKIHPDIVGVIEGNCFANGYYPVVSSTSFDDLNEKLHEDLDGNYSIAGLIVADPSNEENLNGITRIWGHHLGNEEGLMFTSLVNYDSNSYYENHKTLKYYTENGEYVLEVFACTKDNPLNQPIGYQTEEELSQNINDVKERSLIQTELKPSPQDRIFILTTCTKLGSANEPDTRVSVYTKVTPIWEKTPTHAKSI